MFTIFKTIRDVRKGVKDPSGFGAEMAEDLVRGPILVFTIVGILFFVLVFLLGYTEVFGNDFGFFKVVFWILGIPFLLIDLTLWSVFRGYKALVQSAKKRVDDSNVIDVTPR